MADPVQSRAFIHFGAFEVDLSSGELRKSGVKVRLPDQSFQVLAMLTENPGKVVTRNELRERLWPGNTFVDFDDGLNSAVLRLRNALGDSAETPRFVETLPRRGYRFIAPLNGSIPVVQPPVDGFAEPKVAPARVTRKFAGQLGLAAAVLAAVLAALLALNVGGVRRRFFSRRAPVRIHSLAVLPLENLTGDPNQEYFADGMTDALITDLAQIKALRVISRTSTMRYKGAREPLPQIGRELNVDAIVEGTVVRSAGQVRIDAQLIEAATDRHLWAGSYEHDLRDVLALQGEVAQAITQQIQIQVTAHERASLATAHEVNPEAYEDYLRGRFYWNKRTEAGTRKSIEYFDRAVQEDPHYAPAFSGEADAYALLGFYGAIPPREAYPRAQSAAIEALKLDDSLAEAHVSLANSKLWFDWNWPGAEAEMRRAIELNPNYETAYRAYSNFLAAMGRGDEAIAAAKKARNLDPVSITLNTHVGWTLFLTGHEDLAIEEFRKTLEIDPHYARVHRDLSVVLAQKGQADEAVREARKAIELSEATPMMLEALGCAYARGGRWREFRQVLRQVQEQRRTRYVSPFYEAGLYAAAGQDDSAFRLLEMAYRERSSQLVWLNVNPRFDRLRSDARFMELVRRVGLPTNTSSN